MPGPLLEGAACLGRCWRGRRAWAAAGGGGVPEPLMEGAACLGRCWRGRRAKGVWLPPVAGGWSGRPGEPGGWGTGFDVCTKWGHPTTQPRCASRWGQGSGKDALPSLLYVHVLMTWPGRPAVGLWPGSNNPICALLAPWRWVLCGSLAAASSCCGMQGGGIDLGLWGWRQPHAAVLMSRAGARVVGASHCRSPVGGRTPVGVGLGIQPVPLPCCRRLCSAEAANNAVAATGGRMCVFACGRRMRM